jgi:glycosyltransferase involved in cell wall biosynthesis
LLDADPLILLPARITPRKNIEMALQVLASLRESHPAAKLLVTGPTGPHSPTNLGYLESLIELRRELGIELEAVFLATSYPKTFRRTNAGSIGSPTSCSFEQGRLAFHCWAGLERIRCSMLISSS